MRFSIYGPFGIPRNNRGVINCDVETRNSVWEEVEESEPNLSNACGCYIFTIQAPRGALPWYVGKAEKQSFRQACLAAHKIGHLNNEIGKRKKGKPELYLLAKITDKKGKLSLPKKTGHPEIRELESLLIGRALLRNPDLLNSHGTRWSKQLTVDGFTNGKIRKGAAVELRKILEVKGK